ncbi:minimal PKS acyl carrier protein [Glaciihabitans tibetensis]|uniref:Minimal PKS acyl carrier protein n=1 Tax=Glaciihabitans tibetensis TaxID=1266600 RepID=A0A2T0VK52_9MICO|nr:acyl carrier protein [Glaciihabitans tibetensis]PRY70563.1 minimal PKS acyl carrier protein [Glaciihabitans tibetensis]
MNDTFTISDLMTLLTKKAGLPVEAQTDDPSARFSNVGLDSLAFLEMQTALSQAYGVEMPDDQTEHYTFGEIVDLVQGQLEMRSVEQAK